MIDLCNISLGYSDKVLLHDACSSFANGQLTALVGCNGSGKTTLLKTIAGLSQPFSGDILLDGYSLSSLSFGQRARSVAFVSTEKIRVPNLCCRDLVALGRAPYTNWFGKMQTNDEVFVMDALKLVGMEDYALRTMDTLSDGECQRVMIARALAQDTTNIILDEPTSFLDIPNRHELTCLLAELAHKHNKCILFSTHEVEIASRVCDSIVLIESASLTHSPTSDILPSLQAVFGIR